MSRNRTLILLSVVVLAAGGAVLLGRWQLRRLASRRATNGALISARNLPPLDLAQAIRAWTPLDGRRVTVQGTFDSSGIMLLRGRVQFESPGLQVVTPFSVDSTSAVIWVVRGFVPSPDAVTPPDSIPAPAHGHVRLEGLTLAMPATRDSGQALTRNGVTTWNRLDQGVARRLRPAALPVYLLLSGDESGPGRLRTIPPPELTDGPHLSYALQWFGIALAILAFGVIVLRRGGRGSAPLPGAP